MTVRATGRQPDFDLDMAIGRVGELWVRNIREVLECGRLEVKTDLKALQTGNLYVEYECRRKAGQAPSGLAETKAEAWVFLLHPEPLAIVVGVDVLRAVCRELYRVTNGNGTHPYRREETDGSHPTKGVIVPIRRLFKLDRP